MGVGGPRDLAVVYGRSEREHAVLQRVGCAVCGVGLPAALGTLEEVRSLSPTNKERLARHFLTVYHSMHITKMSA